MKKLFASVLLAAVIGTGAFAADLFDLQSGPTPQKQAVFVDVGTTLIYLMAGGIGGGVGYERSFGDTWTGLIHAAFGTYSYTGASAFAFQLDAHGRYYIFKTALDKLFVDVGLGYEYYGYTYASNSNYNWNISSLTITPKAGWKFIFGKGFVVEPSLGYTIGIGLAKPTILYGSTHTASGFNFGIGLGWAF